jgi:hypothetical protein
MYARDERATKGHMSRHPKVDRLYPIRGRSEVNAYKSQLGEGLLVTMAHITSL